MTNEMVKRKIVHTPKVTSPGPLAFGRKPSTLSFSVGSDLQKKKKKSQSDPFFTGNHNQHMAENQIRKCSTSHRGT